MTSARKARDRLGYRLTLAHRVAIFTIDPYKLSVYRSIQELFFGTRSITAAIAS